MALTGKNKERVQRVGMGLGVALVLGWCLLPVIWIISLSFKSQAAVSNGSPGFLPSDGGGAGWTNYVDVIQDDQFRRAIVNSIGISLIATILSVAIATLAAYAIARLEFKGKKFVLTTALVIAMFPVVSLVGHAILIALVGGTTRVARRSDVARRTPASTCSWWTTV